MKKLLLLVALLGLVVSNVCYAQSGKEALRALQKLQTRVEVGISYRDYAPALGDAKFEVGLFLKSPEAKEKEKLALLINKSMSAHHLALVIWQQYIADLQAGLIMRDSRGALINVKYIRHLTDVFPELINVIENRSVSTSIFRSKGEWVWLSDVLNIIWKDAGKTLEEASNLL
jgi:hypothetical protein